MSEPTSAVAELASHDGRPVVYLVREYDYECQEVLYVASTRVNAEQWIEDQTKCTHGPDFHDDDWTVEDCITAARNVGLEIETWALDSAISLEAANAIQKEADRG